MDLEWMCDAFVQIFSIEVAIEIENSEFGKIIKNPMEKHTFYRSGAGFESRKLAKNGFKN